MKHRPGENDRRFARSSKSELRRFSSHLLPPVLAVALFLALPFLPLQTGRALHPPPPLLAALAAANDGRLPTRLVLFFGYSACSRQCPLMLSRLAEVSTGSGEPRAAVVFIDLDPNRRPESVRAWARTFSPEFIGLVSSGREDESRLLRTLGVRSGDLPGGGPSHSTSLYVVGAEAGTVTAPARSEDARWSLETIIPLRGATTAVLAGALEERT